VGRGNPPVLRVNVYEIKVVEKFSSAHNLRHYKGKCEALHGHNWKVEAVLRSKTLGKSGMVMDFGELKNKLKKVLLPLDHIHLNELPAFKKENPTSENIARYIYQKLARIVGGRLRVSVWETDTSSASFEK